MNLNDHSRLRGKHALLSPSNPAFMNLSADDIRERIFSKLRTSIGTEIHEFSFYKIESRSKTTSLRDVKRSLQDYIFKKYYLDDYRTLSREGRRLLKVLEYMPKEVFETVNAYINDAIGFRMIPEAVLASSDRMFGTADTLIFQDGSEKLLRIHDLKTGSTPGKIDQLLGYDALYCLEYGINPNDISHELRIYQNGDIVFANPTGDDIRPIMNKFEECDQIIREFEEV